MVEDIIPDGYRKCTVPECGAILPETPDYFQKAPTGYKGLKRKCKACSAKQAEAYRITQHEKVLAASRAYHEKEKLQHKERKRKQHELHPPVPKLPETERTCKECGVTFPLTTQYFQKNPKSRGGFKLKCKTCSNGQGALYREENRELVLHSNRRWREENREAINEKARAKHWENRNEHNRYERERRTKRREHTRQQARDLYYRNHPYSLAQHKKWRENGKEHRKALFNQEMRAKGLKFCRICTKWWPATRDHFFIIHDARYPHRTPYKGRCKHCFDLTLREKKRCHIRNRRARKRNLPGEHTAFDILDQYRRQRGRCYWCHEKMKKFHVDHIIPQTRPGSSNAPWNLVLAHAWCNESRGNKLPHEWEKHSRLF